jgi:hypothetical protein
MKVYLLAAAAVVSAAPWGLSNEAQAVVAKPSVAVPSGLEQVACRSVRSRIERPDGSVVFKRSRRC